MANSRLLERIEELEQARRNEISGREFLKKYMAALEAEKQEEVAQKAQEAAAHAERERFKAEVERRRSEQLKEQAAEFEARRKQQEAEEAKKRKEAAEAERRRAVQQAIDNARKEREARREAMIAPYRGDPLGRLIEPPAPPRQPQCMNRPWWRG